MSEHLGKIALMVVMGHGFRALGKIFGPRWAGLVLGLPCSTAVTLVGGGSDRGVDYAVEMSGMSLIGLAGAVALPMTFAVAVSRGWRLERAIAFGVAADLFVAFAAGRLLSGHAEASLGLALMAVVAANLLAGRMRVVEADESPQKRLVTSPWNQLLRTVVPIACLLGSLGMGEAFGPGMAGLMSTFPAVTLTVLCLTYLEAGPSSAIRMARALPAGNLGMVAFLASFRWGCPNFGLAWGTVLGYLASLTVLALVVSSDRWRDRAREILGRLGDSRRRTPTSWPKTGRRFSPLFESSSS